MKGTFYDNSGSVKDQFTIKKWVQLRRTPRIARPFYTNTTNGTNTNATNTNATGRDLNLSANSTKVDTDTSGVVIPLHPRPDDNQYSLLNGDGVSSFQDSPKINDSLQVAEKSPLMLLEMRGQN